MKKLMTIAAVTAAVVLGLSACEVEDPSAKDLSQSNGPTVNTNSGTTSDDTASDEPADEGPKLTSSQENAIDSANDYLGQSAFSRKGLIDQLKFEGFGPKVAAFAVDYIHPDWNVQAAKSAKAYLEMESFSKSGLIEQLEFEGFTRAQATYGANKAYR